MKYIVCFSGGHSSALVAVETVRKYNKENVILLNHDISSQVEHKDIKRFKSQVADYLDMPITYANMENYEELTPIKVCRKLGVITNPTNQQALCTYYLKTLPFKQWISHNYPALFDSTDNGATVLYGFDKGEESRMQRRSNVIGTMGYKTDYPLALKHRTIFDTNEIGIAKPITYRIFRHANCIGCLKAGIQHWYIVYCLRRDIFDDAVALELETGYSIIKGNYLEEIIPRYEEMIAKGICPNEKGNSNTFWAEVRSRLLEQESFLPCDCAML